MPIYEYACTSCGHADELIQKASDRPKRKCPECGRLTFKRKISLPRFQLKGTGWYETDFKNKGTQAKPKGDGASDKDAGAESGTNKKDTATADQTNKKTADDKNAA